MDLKHSGALWDPGFWGLYGDIQFEQTNPPSPLAGLEGRQLTVQPLPPLVVSSFGFLL